MKPNDALIRMLIEDPDRSSADRVFVGREEERTLFRDQVRSARRGRPGNTLLIHGAPGAGKTALLQVLKSDLQESGSGRAVEIGVGEIAEGGWLGNLLRREVGWTRRVVDAGRRLKGVSVAGLASLQVESDRDRTDWEAVTEECRRGGLLVLFVDEVQRVGDCGERTTEAGRIAKVLGGIHDNVHGLPVMAVLGGLGHSPEAVRRVAGISRFDRRCIRELAGLQPEEARQALRETFGRCGIDNVPDTWVDEWAEQSQGWPQHLVVIEECVLREGLRRCWSIDPGMKARVDAQARKARAQFYRTRFGGLIDRVDAWEEAARALCKGPVLRYDLERMLQRGLARYEAEDEAKAVVGEAIERGVLSRNEDGWYRVPIPSMARWMLRQVEAFRHFDML